MAVVRLVPRRSIGLPSLVHSEISTHLFKISAGTPVSKLSVVSYEGPNNMWAMHMLTNRVELVIFFKSPVQIEHTMTTERKTLHWTGAGTRNAVTLFSVILVSANQRGLPLEDAPLNSRKFNHTNLFLKN